MKLAWSTLAAQEMQALRRFSIARWGPDVALRYLQDMRDAARAALDPWRAKPLAGAFRLLRVRSHNLIVHVDPDGDRVTIARVLHTAMDIDRHLP